MAVKKLTLKATGAHRGMRLDQLLGIWLPEALGQPLSKAKARKLIVAGAVYLNGKRVRIASKEILPNARIEAFVDLQRLTEGEGTARDVPFAMSPAHVLYEDEYLIAVDKPPGLPTQPTLDEARQNLFAAVKRFLAQRDGRVDPYVGLHHRLDRDTSGVVLLTKKPEANAGVAELFAGRKAQKTYWALTSAPEPSLRDLRPSWSVRDFLAKAPSGGKKNRWQSVRSGGDPAHTDFRVIERFSRGLWIEAMPRTGRTHQIRVHLSEYGLPILGDATYGPKSSTALAPRLMLHAHRLEFEHPITGAAIRIESPMPADFSRCLEVLRRA